MIQFVVQSRLWVVVIALSAGACSASAPRAAADASDAGGDVRDAASSADAGPDTHPDTQEDAAKTNDAAAEVSAGAQCPSAPPSAGAPCSPRTCTYEDCAGVGRTVATCMNGVWSVQTGACSRVLCRSGLCQVGEICLQISSGALTAFCLPNPCGTSAITCECVQCSGQCSVNGGAGGVTIDCNTCAVMQCA